MFRRDNQFLKITWAWRCLTLRLEEITSLGFRKLEFRAKKQAGR